VLSLLVTSEAVIRAQVKLANKTLVVN